MLEPLTILNKGQFERIDRSFELGEQFQENFNDLMLEVGNMILQQAKNVASSASGRVAQSLDARAEQRATGEVIVAIGSSFEGYPGSNTDMTGDPGEAQSKGWATFAHRIHYGYPGRSRRVWNPAAGFTPPTPFLVPVFEQWSKAFFSEVRDGMLRQVLRGY